MTGQEWKNETVSNEHVIIPCCPSTTNCNPRVYDDGRTKVYNDS